jgi:hypothetical protein
MTETNLNEAIGDLISCECCGLVRPETSLLWQLAHGLGSDFPACPTCCVEADEQMRNAGGNAGDHAAICAILEEWSRTGEKLR